MKSSPLTLGPRASFWVSAGVATHTFWTSAAPAMTYPLYAAQWQLTETVTTAIFAVYPIVVVAVLVLLGELSDYYGRRVTMMLGVGASMLGVLAFAVATSVYWLFLGRVLMGLGVGLSAGPSTAAMVEFSPPGESKRASSVTTAAQSLGFVLALLIGGALIQYAPEPTRSTFWVLFAVLIGLFGATLLLPRQRVVSPGTTWRFKAPTIPKEIRGDFSTAALAVTTAYTHGVLILSLGSQVARDLVGSSNVFVNGSILSLFAILGGVLGIAARTLSARSALLLGAFASTVSMGMLSLAVGMHSVWLFVLATAAAGIGYSPLFLGGLQVINAVASPARRGGILSALYLFAYLSLGIVALALGAVATHLEPEAGCRHRRGIDRHHEHRIGPARLLRSGVAQG